MCKYHPVILPHPIHAARSEHASSDITHEGFGIYGQAGKKSSGKIFRTSPVRGESHGRDEQPGWTIVRRRIAIAMIKVNAQVATPARSLNRIGQTVTGIKPVDSCVAD